MLFSLVEEAQERTNEQTDADDRLIRHFVALPGPVCAGLRFKACTLYVSTSLWSSDKFLVGSKMRRNGLV